MKVLYGRIIFNNSRRFSTCAKYDLAVIGGGPGGYTTAIKAAQNGLKVVCIERRPTLGGTCLNCGCIPSKALLNSSHLYHILERGVVGMEIENLRLKYNLVQKSKDDVIKTLNMGINGLFRKNRVDYLVGHASFKTPTSLEVKQVDEKGEISSTIKEIVADNIIIASGSEVIPSDVLKVDGKVILSSNEMLGIQKIPKTLTVVGGGAIGLELASVFNRFGSKVTVLEYAPALCSVMDKDVSKSIKTILEKQGISISPGTKVTGCTVKENSATIKAELSGTLQEFKSEVVLVAMGRRPYLQGLGLEKLNIKTERGRIVVDKEFRVTGHQNIRAIGDAVLGPMLAHKAEEDGMAALGFILNKDINHHNSSHSQEGPIEGQESHPFNYSFVPSVIYTEPEIAGVGATEQQLEKEGIKYKKGIFNFLGNSRAKIYGATEGFVKVLAQEEDNKILGAWIVGIHASELIGQLTLAATYGASTEDVTRMCFPHPSLSEAIKEACLAVHDKPIHS